MANKCPICQKFYLGDECYNIEEHDNPKPIENIELPEGFAEIFGMKG